MRPSILALLLTTTTPALAATIPVDPDRQVFGHFDARGSQVWHVNLRKGLHYAVWAAETDAATVKVAAAGGRKLAAFWTSFESGPHGAGFKAPYTGSYDVTVTCGGNCYPPNDYTLSAGRDCPDGRTTPCRITAGRTLHHLQARFDEDDDWFRTRLVAGRHYRLNLTIEGGNPLGQTMLLAVRDARGRVLAKGPGQGEAGRFVDFTAPASGAYFVQARPDNDEPVATYSLSLSR